LIIIKLKNESLSFRKALNKELQERGLEFQERFQTNAHKNMRNFYPITCEIEPNPFLEEIKEPENPQQKTLAELFPKNPF